MLKQIVIDVLIVISLPILIIGGYFIWFRTNDTALLSAPPILGANPGSEPGVKTKQALDTLKGITLDDSLFTDPAYNALKPFIVAIPSASTSRRYPFTPPPIIEERLRQAKYGHNFSKENKPVATPSDASLAAKIDALKKNSTK